jgi:hypothetical protein
MLSLSYGRKARDILATTSVVGATCIYVSYYSHDNRALSDEEVKLARSTCTRDDIISCHANNLSKYGATVMKGTLSPQQLNVWNAKIMTEFDAGRNTVWNSGRAHISIDERSKHYLDMVRVGGNDINKSNDDTKRIEKKSWLDGSWWSRRRNNNETIVEYNRTHPPPVSLQHIVQSYFEQHGIERYMITQLQFLNAYPNSNNQIWHRDNKFMGLTAIVAMQDIRTNGPTELILGSHQEDYSIWKQCWNCMQNYLPGNFKQSSDNDHNGVNEENSLWTMPLLGCIDAGDAIIYDARIFHRGRGYTEAKEGKNFVDRPVLVLRWDASNTPPPGAGLIVTSANKYLGSIMYALLFVTQKLSEFST